MILKITAKQSAKVRNEVTTHFNPDGKQTVLEQFAELLKRKNF